jgi:hypothetical protein
LEQLRAVVPEVASDSDEETAAETTEEPTEDVVEASNATDDEKPTDPDVRPAD